MENPVTIPLKRRTIVMLTFRLTATLTLRHQRRMRRERRALLILQLLPDAHPLFPSPTTNKTETPDLLGPSLHLGGFFLSAHEPLYQRDLAISEKALGPEHPDVGISLNMAC